VFGVQACAQAYRAAFARLGEGARSGAHP
jgi:hypothetical protein